MQQTLRKIGYILKDNFFYGIRVNLPFLFSSLNLDDDVTMTTVCELAEPLGLTWYTVVPVSTHELTETVSLELSNSSEISKTSKIRTPNFRNTHSIPYSN